MTHRIGISGWTYPPWRGNFYPKGLRQKDELSFAAARFSTIEVNGTFYGLQKPGSFAVWAAQVPDGFVFSVKAPRFITHIKRLRDAEAPVANFLASDVFATFSWNQEQILISCFNVRKRVVSATDSPLMFSRSASVSAGVSSSAMNTFRSPIFYDCIPYVRVLRTEIW